MYIAVNAILYHPANIQCRATIGPPAKLHLKWRFTGEPLDRHCIVTGHFLLQWRFTGEPLIRYCMFTGYFLLQTERLVGEGETGRNNLQRTSSEIYTRVPSSNIYIFSVVAINSTEEHVWDIYTVNVWTYQYLTPDSLWCCFLYKSDVVMRKGILTSIPIAKAQT